MHKGDDDDAIVHFRSDGLALSPAEYSQLLVRLAAEGGIGADEFSRAGVVAELEQRMAALLGKEMAVFLPSGTLANHLALRLLAKNGRRILVQRESHIYNDCGDCAQELSGLTLIPLAPGRATFTLEEVEAELAHAEDARVATPVGVISIESPVRRLKGEVFDFAEMQRIAAFARERRLGLHFDGARVFLATPYTGIEPAQYAGLFDTVYVSLYKYFNAAGGAVLAGPRSLLGDLYHQRRMFGGSLRQAWPYGGCAELSRRFRGTLPECRGGGRGAVVGPASAARLPGPAPDRDDQCEPPADCGCRCGALADRLLTHGIAIRPAGRITGEWAEFELFTNETILRRPIEQTIEAFVDSLGGPAVTVG
jgi:threonine aldolase